MATTQGLKGVCVDVASRVGKTKPFGLKGVIFPEAAASAPRLAEVCGQPYRRKGICAPSAQFMPALAEVEEEAAGKSMRKSANANEVGRGVPAPGDEEEINPF
jgi:hypothetical protein